MDGAPVPRGPSAAGVVHNNGADADGTPMEKWEAFLEEKPAVMTFFDSPRAQVKPEDEVTAFLMDVTARD